MSDTAAAPRRYLWTDAFAVCNFLQLFRTTGDEQHLARARRLVEQVHFVLGRFAASDARSGWISGLDEEEGRAHPTIGGLRIGKPLPERRPHEPIDDRLEWDRDGQYLHYLTRWIQALVRMALATDESRYARWAVELAQAAHKGFCYRPAAGGAPRLYWKMSVDLGRPLVTSMGHHDPLDALTCYCEAQTVAASLADSVPCAGLQEPIADCLAMCAGRSWATEDPLGTGGLLADAASLAQTRSGPASTDALRLETLLAESAFGLEAFARSGLLQQPAERRLAFRELGLAIGIHALDQLVESGAASAALLAARYRPLAEEIEAQWQDIRHQQSDTWRDHLEINRVMLATSLAPRAYLKIG